MKSAVCRFVPLLALGCALIATGCDESPLTDAGRPRDAAARDAAPRDAAGRDAQARDAGREDAGRTDGGAAVEQTLTTLLAFPSAMGAGSIATGGRGGRVLHVTTLADEGPGSLRAALLETGPRTVVFDVSGRIELATRIEMIAENGDLTIAGQTAPEGGVTISGRTILMGGGYNRPTSTTDNVVVRHVRIRNGSYTGESDVFDHNGIVSNGGERWVYDHMSFSFNDDQALSLAPFFGPLRDGTIQRCIFSENATGIILGAVSQTGQADRLSTLENLFVHQGHRTPNLALDGRADVINNVMFSWGSRLATVVAGSPDVNFIGNHLTAGSNYSAGTNNKVHSATPRIYTGDNFHSVLHPTPAPNDRDLWTQFFSSDAVADTAFTDAPHPLLANTTVRSAEHARQAVLADAGTHAFVSDDGTRGRYVDSYDTQRVQDVHDAQTRDPFNKSWTQPTLPTQSRPEGFYGALPDIPAFFVEAHGITANDQVLDRYDFGAVVVVNDAGYTALEMYLAYAAGDFAPAP